MRRKGINKVLITKDPVVHICDDCIHAHWVNSHSNYDWEGKPICMVCKYESHYIIRGHIGCKMWESKKGVCND